MAGLGGYEIKLDRRELYGHITMTVIVPDDWRCIFGLWLMKLGAKLMGMNLATDEEKEEEGER